MAIINVPPNDERRAVQRTPINQRARLHSDFGIQGCIVTEISVKGARIGLAADTALPLRFELEFIPTGRRVPVQLIWQHGSVAGVQFKLQPTLLERLDVRTWFRRT